jgi:hypothetical protein
VLAESVVADQLALAVLVVAVQVLKPVRQARKTLVAVVVAAQGPSLKLVLLAAPA